MEVISAINMKGGVGKTTLLRELAATFARDGARVLCLDNDWQANLTQGLIGKAATFALPASETIAGVFEGTAFPAAVIRPTAIPGLDLVPGSLAASRFGRPEPWAEPWPMQVAIRELLAEVAPRYDLALIDCHPDMGLCTWSALTASGWALIPVQPEDYGSQGIGIALDLIRSVRGRTNPGLGVLGLVFTMAQRQAIHLLYEEAVRAEYGALCLDAKLPRAPVFLEAVAHLQAVAISKPRSAGAKAVQAIAGEIRARMAAAAAPATEAA